MLEGTYSSTFKEDPEMIFKLISDHENSHTWREDLVGVDVVEENKFVEKVIDGSLTEIEVVKSIPNEWHEVTMKSKNFSSHWVVRLEETEEGGTELEIAERYQPAKNIVGFVSRYILKLEQVHQKYIQNLAWELSEIPLREDAAKSLEAEENFEDEQDDLEEVNQIEEAS